MMTKLKLKRILGVVILTFTILSLLYSYINVSAKTAYKCSDDKWVEKMTTQYGASIAFKNGDYSKVIVSINPESDDKTLLSNMKEMEFKVYIVNPEADNLLEPKNYADDANDKKNNAIDTGFTIKYSKKSTRSVELDYQIASSLFATENDEMQVDLIATSSTSKKNGNCDGFIKISLTISKESNASVKKKTEDLTNVSINNTVRNPKKAIDCSSSNLTEFETEFCKAKKNASNKNTYEKEFDSSTNKISSDVTKKFSCDAQRFEGSDYPYTTTSDANGYKYYNISYLYGKLTTTYTSDKSYKYHYKLYAKEDDTENNAVNGETPSCNVTCEEGVTVEYGPPVASKAGLCFEYQVKVTSRVSCYVKDYPNEPKQSKATVCTPTPQCIYSKNKKKVFYQGGPSEEFDSCISSCDGGKYTDKCTNKCYKQVYGSSTSSTTKTSNLALNYSDVSKISVNYTYSSNSYLEYCINNSSNQEGCYYYSDNGDIYWSGAVLNKDKTDYMGTLRFGRWYNEIYEEDNSYKCALGKCWENPSAGYTGDYYIHNVDAGDNKIAASGIFYHHYTKTNTTCSDDCSWILGDCNYDTEYMNYNMAAKDKQENQKIYDALVSKCEAAASCSTSTATFTISVDYSTNGSTDVKTIDFPYSSESDKLTSKGEGYKSQDTVCTSNNKNSCKSTILSYAGCYSDGSSNNWYQTVWSFPGTWINNKTGEISYKAIDSDAWQTMSNKFCLPLNAANVNTKWWNYYYSKRISGTAIEDDAFESECESNGQSCNTTNSIKNIGSISDNDIKSWNINALATNFGHFEWNIQVSCFYALNTDPCLYSNDGSDSSKCDNTKCCTNETADADYTIRSVDLTDLFPSTSGTVTNGTSEGKKSTTGRNPGFNWTSYANNEKNSSFTSKPSEYLTEVQTLGYNVYDNDYLDYEFDISSSTLKKLKNKTSNYTDFNGKSYVQNGVTVYESNLFRGTGVLVDSVVKIGADDAIPKLSVLGCNNIKNYSSTTCES